jgi:TetR/AcrR family fatty acid metabolism transcriptional regulator
LTRPDKEGRRKQIIEAAMREFAKNGYHKTEVATIAQRAGVSKGTIYNYFENKEELLIGVIDDGFQSLSERMQEILSSSGDPIQKLSDTFKAYLAFFETPEEFSQILLKEAVHIIPRVRGQYSGHLLEHVEYLEKIIRDGIAQEQLEDVDVRLAALCFIDLAHAATKESSLINRKLDTEKDHKMIMQLFLNGIKKK